MSTSEQPPSSFQAAKQRELALKSSLSRPPTDASPISLSLQLARLYSEVLDDPESAASLLSESLPIAKAMHPGLALEIANELGKLHIEKTEMRAAVAVLTEVRSEEADSEAVVVNQCLLAKAYSQLGEVNKAEDCLRNGQTLAEDKCPKSEAMALVCTSLCELADIFSTPIDRKHLYSAARSLYTQPCKALVEVNKALGSLMEYEQDPEETDQYFLAAVEQAKQLNEQGAAYLSALMALDAFYANYDVRSEREPVLVKIHDMLFSKDPLSADSEDTLRELVAFYETNEEFTKPEEVIITTLKEVRSRYPESIAATRLLGELGAFYLRRDRQQEAEDFMIQSWKSSQRLSASEQVKALRSLRLLYDHYEREDEKKQTILEILRALQASDPIPEDILEAYTDLASWYDEHQEPEEAEKAYVAAVEAMTLNSLKVQALNDLASFYSEKKPEECKRTQLKAVRVLVDELPDLEDRNSIFQDLVLLYKSSAHSERLYIPHLVQSEGCHYFLRSLYQSES